MGRPRDAKRAGEAVPDDEAVEGGAVDEDDEAEDSPLVDLFFVSVDEDFAAIALLLAAAELLRRAADVDSLAALRLRLAAVESVNREVVLDVRGN